MNNSSFGKAVVIVLLFFITACSVFPIGRPEVPIASGSIAESKEYGAFLWQYEVIDLSAASDSLAGMLSMKEVFLENSRWYRKKERDYVLNDSMAVLVMNYGDTCREQFFRDTAGIGYARVDTKVLPDKFGDMTRYYSPDPPASLVFYVRNIMGQPYDISYMEGSLDTLCVHFSFYKDCETRPRPLEEFAVMRLRRIPDSK